MTDYTVGQQLWQMAQMAAVGWVMLLTAHEKQSLALCGRWRYGKKTVIDFLFCLLWGVLLWLVLLRVSGGLLRNYIVFGLLSGAIVYHLACRRWLNRPCLFLARGILFAWHWFCRFVMLPWHLLNRWCWQPCRKMIQNFFVARQETDAEEENITEKNENNFSS